MYSTTSRPDIAKVGMREWGVHVLYLKVCSSLIVIHDLCGSVVRALVMRCWFESQLSVRGIYIFSNLTIVSS